MSVTAEERIAARWDGRADRETQEYLVRAAGLTRRLVGVMVADVVVAAAILLTGPLSTGRLIAACAVPFVGSGVTTYLVFRRAREFRGAAAIVADRQGLPTGTYLDFRGVTAFDRSLAAARSRPAAH